MFARCTERSNPCIYHLFPFRRGGMYHPSSACEPYLADSDDEDEDEMENGGVGWSLQGNEAEEEEDEVKAKKRPRF